MIPRSSRESDRTVMALHTEFDGELLVITLSGTLMPSDLVDLATRVIALERGGMRTPPRITDLRGVEEMAVSHTDFARLAERARDRPLDRPIRSAVLVAQPVQLGYARMFQILNEHPQVTVRIFDDETAARAWVLSADDETRSQ